MKLFILNHKATKRRGEVEASSKHDITKNQDTASVVVAPGFNVGVGHQEHRKYDDDDIPRGKDKSERLGYTTHLFWNIPSRKCYHSWDLQKTDLQCVG